MYDYHVHSNYSDGRFLFQMVEAAADAGLDGVGFADHCTVSERPERHRDRTNLGFNLDLTHERRRRAIEDHREDAPLALYDAVEMDYHPEDEMAIADFLDGAGFEYAIGSVHELDGANAQDPSAFVGRPEAELDRLVDRYFDRLVALVESELFDVAAHPDLVERTAPLAGRATEEQYRRVARAFAESRTVPEVNAGRALRDDPIVHPTPAFLDALRDHDVPVTVGTDSHFPEEIDERLEFLSEFCADRGLEPVAPPGLDR